MSDEQENKGSKVFAHIGPYACRRRDPLFDMPRKTQRLMKLVDEIVAQELEKKLSEYKAEAHNE